jgi:hypothetical protein
LDEKGSVNITAKLTGKVEPNNIDLIKAIDKNDDSVSHI